MSAKTYVEWCSSYRYEINSAEGMSNRRVGRQLLLKSGIYYAEAPLMNVQLLFIISSEGLPASDTDLDTWKRCPSSTNAVEQKNRDCKTATPQSLPLNTSHIDTSIYSDHGICKYDNILYKYQGLFGTYIRTCIYVSYITQVGFYNVL